MVASQSWCLVRYRASVLLSHTALRRRSHPLRFEPFDRVDSPTATTRGCRGAARHVFVDGPAALLLGAAHRLQWRATGHHLEQVRQRDRDDQSGSDGGFSSSGCGGSDTDRLKHIAGRWQPDPYKRHERRWWDGAVTEHVADQGVQSTDPVDERANRGSERNAAARPSLHRARRTPAEPPPEPRPARRPRSGCGHRCPTRSSLRSRRPGARHRRCPSATTPSTATAPTVAISAYVSVAWGVTSPCRIKHRSIDVRPGNATTPSCSSQYKIVRGPHPGCAAHLHDPRLDHRRHLMRARQRLRRPIGQPAARRPRSAATSRAPSGATP